jgi:hypothetical protein
MTQWEYYVREVQDASTQGETATLNLDGHDGWELIHVYNYTEKKSITFNIYNYKDITRYYFKRPKS